MLEKIVIIILLKTCFNTIEYKILKKNMVLNLYFESVDSLNYVYLNYSEDYELDDLSIFNEHYYLLIDKELNVTCKLNQEKLLFENFDKHYDSECKIIQYNEYFNIIRYNKLTNSSLINLFIFYIDNSSSKIYGDTYRVKKLDIPFRLENKTNLYKGISKDIKIFFTELTNIFNNNFFFLTNKNEKISFFIEFPGSKVFIKKNNFGKNKVYKLFDSNDDWLYYEGQSVILIYDNPSSYEDDILIGMKVINDGRINVFNLKKNENVFTNSCGKEKIYILNSENDILFNVNFNSFITFKYFKSNFEKFEDLFELNNYEEMIDNYYYSGNNNYGIFYSDCLSLEIYKVNYYLIEEKGNNIYYQNFTFFQLSQYNSLTFQIMEKKEELITIIIKLLSDKETSISINSKNEIYNFKKQNQIIKINNINSKENLIITSKGNKATFGIKIEIPKNLIQIKNAGENYIFQSNESEKFIIFKVNNTFLNKYWINLINISFNTSYDILFYKDSGYKTLDEISINSLSSFTEYDISNIFDFGRIKLSKNKEFSKDKFYYYLFYFSNLNPDIKIEFNSNNKGILNLRRDKFTKLENLNNSDKIYIFYKDNNIRYFVIPCSNNFTLNFGNKQIFSYPSYYNYYMGSGEYFSYKGESFLSYYIYNDMNSDFENYYYNTLCNDNVYFYILNNTHFRLSFPLFSNCQEIKYTLIITKVKNEKYLNSTCNFFDNFYMKNLIKSDIEIYNFSSNNVISRIIDINLCINNSYVDLLLPKKINIKNKDKYIIRLMGITGPKVHDVKIYDKIYFIYDGFYISVQIIFLILFVLIIIIGIIVYYFKNKKTKIHYALMNIQEMKYKKMLS